MQCQHIWSCPTCSLLKRAKFAERLCRAMKNAGGRWQMITVTLRHKKAMPLAETRKVLSDCWRRTRQGGAVQRVWERNVQASARVLEVTHGQNGWHPHMHVLLHGQGWHTWDRLELADRWRRIVVQRCGGDMAPSAERGIRWSGSIDATSESERGQYLAKVGLEIASIGKLGRGGSRNPWQIAEAAAGADGASLALWREYVGATRGVRMFWLDPRGNALAKMPTKDPPLREGDVPRKEPVWLDMWGEEIAVLRRLERGHPTVMHDVLKAVETADDPRAELQGWLQYALRSSRNVSTLRADDRQPD